MPVQRKVFRIEERARPRDLKAAPPADSNGTSHHHGFTNELQSLRVLIEPQAAADRGALEKARAQVAEAQAFKQELALIHAAVERSTDQMAALGVDARSEDTARASRELAAIVGGTERATEAILHAAEEIDHAAVALTGMLKGGHDQGLAHDICDRVVQIFEACNFQDITGQRVNHVVATLRRVEQHVARLMEIWAQVEQFAPVMTGAGGAVERRLLNGPKLPGARGHSSQDDVDAFFRSA